MFWFLPFMKSELSHGEDFGISDLRDTVARGRRCALAIICVTTLSVPK